MDNKCGLCDRKDRLSSIYIYKREDDVISICTECANKLRFDGKHNVAKNYVITDAS